MVETEIEGISYSNIIAYNTPEHEEMAGRI